jgi:small subunit ribosomal protein S6
MNNYERKALLQPLSDAVTKHKGAVIDAAVWAEKKKLYFPLKKHHEGLYYLMHFTLAPEAVKEVTHAYRLNENILRVLITK